MVFAAGRGKRMRYMTNFKAKPLVEINQECLLDTNIKKIASSGISKIIVNASYKHLSIKRSLNKDADRLANLAIDERLSIK